MAAWVLNLDADLELGRVGPYQPTVRVRQAMRPHVERLRALLLGPDDVVVDDVDEPARVDGLAGRAFCPTPRAVALLRRAGAAPDPFPPVEVLRRVNSRAFASSLGPTLPGAAFVTDAAAGHALLCRDPELGAAWRVKHAFGMSGRNQRVVPARSADERDLEFVRRGVARGGVQIEPDVSIAVEYATHGFVREDGSFEVGALVRQRCDSRGAWVATERIDRAAEPPAGVRERIDAEARAVARALHLAGYHGPFGVDAFTYRDRAGALCLQPRSEVNARYSMGFATGFGGAP